MTLTLFITILTIGSILNVLLTEAIKKAFKNEGKEAPANFIALADAAVCGGGVTAVLYMLMGIAWTLNNVICLICVMFFVWLGAMTSYDKVMQTIVQISKVGAAQLNADTKLESGKEEAASANQSSVEARDKE